MKIEITPHNFHAELIDASNQKIIAAFFYADQIVECHPISTQIIQAVGLSNQKLTLAMIDVSYPQLQSIAVQIGLQALPSIVIFKDGKPIDAIMGAHESQVYEMFISKYLKDTCELISNVFVPDIGGDEVYVTEILVKVGDIVQADQSLITVEGDKASLEVPAPFAGVVKKIKTSVGDKVATGSLIMEFSVINLEPVLSIESEPVDTTSKDSTDVFIPDIGGDEVCVTEILVKVGDIVQADQSLITVEGDKASLEVPAPFAGVVKKIKISVGDKVQTGSLIMEFSSINLEPVLSIESEPVDTPSKDSTDVFIPDIGGDEVDVTEILVKVGDIVHADQSLITVEGYKASLDVPAPFAGVVKKIKISVGDKVQTGSLIMEFSNINIGPVLSIESEPVDTTSKDSSDVFIPDICGYEVDVTEILVNVGDIVQADQSLITVEGDKAFWEVPAPFSGVVKKIKISVGDKLQTGSVIMEFDKKLINAIPSADEDELAKDKFIESGIQLDKNTFNINRDILDESLKKLSARSTIHYQNERNKKINEYSTIMESISSEKLSEQTGISPAAFTEIDTLSYLPGHEFPEILRLGSLNFKEHSPLSQEAVPWLHDLSERKSLVISDFDNATSSAMLQNIALRVLSSVEPNLIQCYFIDSVGLGQSFSYLTNLSDAIKGNKILTEPSEIEHAMLAIKAHAVNLVQEKLTHQYESLKAYNKAAGGKLAEPYRCVFISNFPCGFNQRSIETLSSIINASFKSGISVFMSLDTDELTKSRSSVYFPIHQMPISVITPTNIADLSELNNYFTGQPDNKITANATNLIQKINAEALLIQNKKVDLDDIGMSSQQQLSSAVDISIPIGLIGKENPCYLTLGNEKSGHHVLVGGATGSGKTVLLHNIITNGALLYSPDELSFFLLDYKEGTEFKYYKNLPHVHILSMESNRPFGLSVLQYVLEEMERRGKLFKEASVATLRDYKINTGNRMPRVLVVIDEFQVLLKGTDRLSSQVAELFDDIVRRGRSFGIHLVLATQTLADVHLKPSTLSNISIRIGLRMSESDSVRIFHRDNPIAATLKKSGEAYFNAAHGQSEGNIRFQVAWLDIKKVEEKILDIQTYYSETTENDVHRYLMDGHSYANFQSEVLNKFVENHCHTNSHLFSDILLAEPGYISKQLISIRLKRQFSSNILAVGDSPADVISLSLLILYQLIQQSSQNSHFYVVDLFAVDTPWFGQLNLIANKYPEKITSVRPNRLPDLLEHIEQIIADRLSSDEPSKDRVVLFLLNTQAARIFDSSSSIGGSPATKKLIKIIRDGAECGIHLFLHSTQYQGLDKIFSDTRSILNEFENKIVLRSGEKLISGCEPIKNEGLAYIVAKNTRYDVDPCRLYLPQQVLKYFSLIGEAEHVC